MKCHEVDYEILGHDMQIVEVELDPGETVIAEAGAMNYMEDGITFESRMGDGSQADEGIFGKLMGAGKRALTGESLFLTHFTNTGSGKKRVSFAAP
ncbi:MAG: AIM24 family protein, partial [Thermodesulfobacteriota bacterium]|nr:AIM24 family protein [Thermodesulfobacteriota bacterium]